jgi:hypothetical protein
VPVVAGESGSTGTVRNELRAAMNVLAGCSWHAKGSAKGSASVPKWGEIRGSEGNDSILCY